MIEKILNEISRLKKELKEYSASEALDYIEAFINAISEEPANEDLEEYYKNEFLPKEWFVKSGQRTISQFNFFTARHFAEWQKQKDFQDFMEKAEEFFNDELYVSIANQICSVDDFTSMTNFIEQFKNFMKNESEN
jgi:hypothetical protein